MTVRRDEREEREAGNGVSDEEKGSVSWGCGPGKKMVTVEKKEERPFSSRRKDVHSSIFESVDEDVREVGLDETSLVVQRGPSTLLNLTLSSPQNISASLAVQSPHPETHAEHKRRNMKRFHGNKEYGRRHTRRERSVKKPFFGERRYTNEMKTRNVRKNEKWNGKLFYFSVDCIQVISECAFESKNKWNKYLKIMYGEKQVILFYALAFSIFLLLPFVSLHLA